jgi:predicted nucleotidyltransferase
MTDLRRQFGVKRLELFGSAACFDFDPDATAPTFSSGF